MKETHLGGLLAAVGDIGSLLILPHNDPDPDAIASAVGLQHLLRERLGVESSIRYKGIIGRAENTELVRYLGRPLRKLRRADLRHAEGIALVDTQPGAGNNPLSTQTSPTLVIDHHPLREESLTAPYADVRVELGATSTIITGYLQEAGIEPSRRLATGLFYGIKTDTMGLIRNASAEDVSAYFFLQPLIDVEALVRIERAQVPAEYFRRLSAALQAAQVHNGVVTSAIGSMSRPDMAAEMADLLMRLQGAQWVICTGVYKNELILAIRTRSRQGGAGRLALEIVGDRGTAGGHGVMAGGQIRLREGEDDPDRLSRQLMRRALAYLQVAPGSRGKPLI
jgi:nanoRNase/pAp phosphatase (c-di-AMP/oligoRNAs hydrolase)